MEEFDEELEEKDMEAEDFAEQLREIDDIWFGIDLSME